MEQARRYSPDERQRVVDMLFEHRAEYPSEWATMSSIAPQFDITPETLRTWVRRAEIDKGLRPGLTTDERGRLKHLERKVKELRRANDILRAESAFFGTELDGRTPS